jgi:hypothetical protein
MKNILASLILLFFVTTNSCYAFSELYYFKNIKTSEVEPIVNSAFNNNSYKIIKQNPYYAVSEYGSDYAIIVLQQSGNNMFYYYNADKNSKINKSVIKEIKNRDIVCEQSFNSNIISIYDDIAADLIKNSGTLNPYVFSDNEPEQVQTLKPNPTEPKVYSGYIAQVASGTKFNVYLQNAINTATATQGDTVIAVVQDGINYNGDIVIPQGSLVYGTLSKARNATYGSMNGKVIINFNRIITPENIIYNIETEKINFTVSNEGKVSDSAKSAVSSAAVGALIGLLFGVLSNSGHIGRSAAIGAGVGAGSSIIYSAAEKGVDAEIPSFTELELTLTSPLSVNVSR